MRPKQTVTITDVAHKADVSIATVSRVINGLGSVRGDTTQRVQSAMQQLGYETKVKIGRNEHPTRFCGKPTEVPIAFLLVGQFNPNAQSPITRHLETALEQIATSLGHPFSAHTITDLSLASAQTVLGKAQGVILRTSNIEDIDQETVEWLGGRPAVQLLGKSRTGRCRIDHIGPDNQQAGALAAEYLLGLGCSKLVFASTNTKNQEFRLERCQAFVKSAAAAGVECRAYFQALSPGPDQLKKTISHYPADYKVFEKRNDLIRAIARENPDSFGLFAPTDIELSMLIQQLQMLDVDFGGTCHAIGCDREVRCFAGVTPVPATMDLLVDTLAERAVRRLRHRIMHPNDAVERTLVSPRMVLPEELFIS